MAEGVAAQPERSLATTATKARQVSEPRIHFHHRGQQHDADHFIPPWGSLLCCEQRPRPRQRVVAADAPLALPTPAAGGAWTDVGQQAASEIQSLAKTGIDDLEGALESTSTRDLEQFDKTHWHTMRENFEEDWELYSDKADPQILTSLHISPDGGLNDADIQYLWGEDNLTRLTKCWGALQMCVCVLTNVGYVIYSDVSILQKSDDSHSQKFLVGHTLWKSVIADHVKLTPEQFIVAIELTLITLLLITCFKQAVMSFCARRPCERWRCVSILFWRSLPMLSSFTAMKLLFWVDPWILFTELFLEFTLLKSRLSHGHWIMASFRFFWYILTRVFCFIIGLDAFLVKFRETNSLYVDKEDFTFSAFFGSVTFLFQVIGVVNLSFVVRSRLFFFIFGGEDCAVSSKDKATEWLWNAMLARKIWNSNNFPRFLIIMLSFTDYDIQHLLLKGNVDGHIEKSIDGEP